MPAPIVKAVLGRRNEGSRWGLRDGHACDGERVDVHRGPELLPGPDHGLPRGHLLPGAVDGPKAGSRPRAPDSRQGLGPPPAIGLGRSLDGSTDHINEVSSFER